MHLMTIASLIILLVQILCVIHALHQGYSYTFVMMVLLVPLVGAIGYLIIEFGPRVHYLPRKHNPSLELIARQQAAKEKPTIENFHDLARCYLSLEDYEQALRVLDSLLINHFSQDPYLLLDKAKALFGLEKFNEAKFILEIVLNQVRGHSTYAKAHLLFARSLAALGEFQLANREFEKLQNYDGGLEASYYYLKHLRQFNEKTRAEEVLHHMRKRLNRLPKHFQSKEQPWLKQAQKEN